MTTAWVRLGREVWRDLRDAELKLLALAVMLGVAVLSAVSLLSDRLQAGMQRDAARLLGGDVVVVSDQPTPESFLALGRELGLRGVTTLSFPTMVRNAQGEGRLVALKAAASGYPLKGEVRLIDEASGASGGVRSAHGLPEPGQAWIEPALAQALDLRPGDALMMGELQLQVSALIDTEPDRGAGFMNFAPRLFVGMSDVQRSGLIQPASRVTWRYALVGPPDLVRAYTRRAQGVLERHEVRGVRLETLEAGRPEMKQTLDRAGQFLRLVALMAGVLCAVVVGLSARAFALKRVSTVALLRVLGLTQREITLRYTLQALGVGLLASALGLVGGALLQEGLVQWLSGLIEVDLPWPGWGAWAWGLGVGATLLIAFGLPPVLRLSQVSALRIMRRDLGAPPAATWWVMGLGLVGFAVLMVQASQDLKLGLIVMAGLALAMGLFAALAWLALRLLRAWVNEQTAPVWMGLATRQMAARPALVVLQVSAMALGWMALMLLVLLRTDLMQAWQQVTPTDAPNRFVINIQPEQGTAFQAQLQQSGVRAYDWYPMIRGRLVEINGQSVGPEQYRDERAKRLVDREFNLSHTATLPRHNQIVAGSWTPEQTEGLSMEEGIARTLGVKLGDQLRFDLAGWSVQGRVTSLRHLEWTSMRANFFVLFPVSSMPDVPMTYMTAYRSPEAGDLDRALLKRFPNITQVDLSATLRQVQGVIEQVGRAVETLFLFAVVGGLMVLVAVVVLTRDERLRDHAVLRALGAQRQVLTRLQWAELVGTGALSGALAAASALLIAGVLAREVFDFAWSLPWWSVPLGSVLAASVAALVGHWTLRGVLQTSVTQTLRQSES